MQAGYMLQIFSKVLQYILLSFFTIIFKQIDVIVFPVYSFFTCLYLSFNESTLYTTNFIGPLSYQAFSFLKLRALS